MRIQPFVMTLLLAACAQDPDKASLNDQKAEEAVQAGFRPGGPAPMETDTTDAVDTPRPGALLPPATLKYRYIGRWAATPAMCASAPWVFESKKIDTGGETSCAFVDTANVIDGYELLGTCSAGHRDIEDTVHLTFNDQARTMHVEAKSLGPIDLIYCGA